MKTGKYEKKGRQALGQEGRNDGRKAGRMTVGQKGRKAEAGIQADRQMYRKRGGQIYIQTYRNKHVQTYTDKHEVQKCRKAGRQTDRRTTKTYVKTFCIFLRCIQTDRQTQKDKQTNRQIGRKYTCMCAVQNDHI
jgi:hypothetical protein